MPSGWFTSWGCFELPALPSPCDGKRRGVTQSPKRKKRRNRRKP